MTKWIVIGVLMLVGVVFTVADYRGWQHAEMDKYGQGYADNRREAEPLANLYDNKWAGARVRYPEEWQVKELKKVSYNGDGWGVLKWDRQTDVASWDEMMTMSVTKTTKTLPDVVVEEVKEINKQGMMLRDTEGLELDTATEGRILTWETGSGETGKVVHQEAVAKRGDKVIRLTCKTSEGDWPNWEKTWLEIFKTLVMY